MWQLKQIHTTSNERHYWSFKRVKNERCATNRLATARLAHFVTYLHAYLLRHIRPAIWHYSVCHNSECDIDLSSAVPSANEDVFLASNAVWQYPLTTRRNGMCTHQLRHHYLTGRLISVKIYRPRVDRRLLGYSIIIDWTVVISSLSRSTLLVGYHCIKSISSIGYTLTHTLTAQLAHTALVSLHYIVQSPISCLWRRVYFISW